MARDTSLVYLEKGLIKDATLTGQHFHRSAAEQIEYWARIGRQVTNTVDPDSILYVVSGCARFQIEPVYAKAIRPEAIFLQLEHHRNQGTLATSVTSSAVKY